MNPMKYLRNGKRDKSFAQMGLLTAVPAILMVAPLVGYFAGSWADRRFGTEPFLLILGLVLGFSAAGREIYRLVKKAQALDEEKDD